MKLIYRYISKELIPPFLFSLSIFTGVLLIGNIVKLADLVINRGIPISSVVRLFFNLVPFLLGYTLPLSYLAAVLFAFGRLSADNEIIALSSSGVRMFRLIRPVLFLGALFCLSCFLLNDKALPMSHFYSRKLLADISLKNPASYFEAGTFIKTFKKYIIFIYEIEGNRLKDIRIYEPQKDKPCRTIIAQRGEFIIEPGERKIKLKLQNGSSSETDANNPSKFFTLDFKTYYLTLDVPTMIDLENIEKKPKEMGIKELKLEMERFGRLSIDTIPLAIAINKRLAISFSPLAFALIGFSLGARVKRETNSIIFVMSLSIALIYYVSLITGEALALKGHLSPWLAMWLPNILTASAGLGLGYVRFERI